MEQQMEDSCNAPRPDPLDPTKSLVFCNVGWVVDGKCMANQMAQQWSTSGRNLALLARPPLGLAWPPSAPPHPPPHTPHSLTLTLTRLGPRHGSSLQGIGAWVSSLDKPIPLDTCRRKDIRSRDYQTCSGQSRCALRVCPQPQHLCTSNR